MKPSVKIINQKQFTTHSFLLKQNGTSIIEVPVINNITIYITQTGEECTMYEPFKINKQYYIDETRCFSKHSLELFFIYCIFILFFFVITIIISPVRISEEMIDPESNQIHSILKKQRYCSTITFNGGDILKDDYFEFYFFMYRLC
jgi:hypothetical protein